ncbi:MAG: hypothetical protein IKC09_01225 [Oscillospiraceae bacterium]|nr:hypothetical protein [Oscillospiraceae bacterium]
MKLLLRIVTQLLGMRDTGDEPRADMYLPDRMLGMAIIFLLIGIGLAVAACFTLNPYMILGAVVMIPVGIAALLCWKNQKINMVTSGTFEYTTFLGNTKTYRFADITGLRRNQDSLTLFVGKEKIHIESMAVLSDRLIAAINNALQQKAE